MNDAKPKKKQTTSTPLVYMLAGILLVAFGSVFLLESTFLGFILAGWGAAMFLVGAIAAGVALGLEQHARLTANATLAKRSAPMAEPHPTQPQAGPGQVWGQ